MPEPSRDGQETECATIGTLQDGHSQLIVIRTHSIDTYLDTTDNGIPISHMLGYTTACNRRAQKQNEEEYRNTLHAEVSL
jgi:hypothetical protein